MLVGMRGGRGIKAWHLDTRNMVAADLASAPGGTTSTTASRVDEHAQPPAVLRVSIAAMMHTLWALS